MKEKAGKRNGLARCSQARSVAPGASHWASQLTPTTGPTWVAHPMCRPTASGGLKRMSAWRWPRSGLAAHGTIAGWPCCTVAAWLRCAFKASSRPPRSKLAHIACTTTACGSSALSQSEPPPHCSSTRRRSCSRGAGWNARDTSDGATLELRSWARPTFAMRPTYCHRLNSEAGRSVERRQQNADDASPHGSQLGSTS